MEGINYHDILNWIDSPVTKGKDIHITLFQSKLLNKLIFYSNINGEVTYSNDNLSEYFHCSSSHIENNISILKKKKYITCKIFKKKDYDTGKLYSKRIIKINWGQFRDVQVLFKEYLKERDKIKEEKGNNRTDNLNIISTIISENNPTGNKNWIDEYCVFINNNSVIQQEDTFEKKEMDCKKNYI